MTWSREPEAREQVYKVPLLRIEPGKPQLVVFLNPTAMGRYLHWRRPEKDELKGRTVPCEEKNCPYCAANVRRDWKLYISVWLPASDQVAVAEMPYSALKYFQEQYIRAQTCYGFHGRIVRVGGKKQGPVEVTFQQKYAGINPLPEGPDPIEYMATVWRIRFPDPTPEKQTGSKARQGTASQAFYAGRLGALPPL